MSSVYVSVGHGVRPNGTFDPGAVHTTSGALEYDGNRDLAAHVTAALRAAGHHVDSEADQPNRTDPDYQGSVDLVNAGSYALAVDFHQDWEQGNAALCWPLVHPAGQESRRIANSMIDACQTVGLSTAGPTNRDDLWWLNGTNCPAVLVEAGRVGTPRPVADLAAAIAQGISVALGDPSLPEGPLAPAGTPGAPPGDTTIPPAGQFPPWPGTLLEDFTAGHGTATWQAQMVKRGWYLVVDDQYGPASASTAQAFQLEKFGPDGVDGIVGPETWDAAWVEPVT